GRESFRGPGWGGSGGVGAEHGGEDHVRRPHGYPAEIVVRVGSDPHQELACREARQLGHRGRQLSLTRLAVSIEFRDLDCTLSTPTAEEVGDTTAAGYGKEPQLPARVTAAE